MNNFDFFITSLEIYISHFSLEVQLSSRGNEEVGEVIPDVLCGAWSSASVRRQVLQRCSWLIVCFGDIRNRDVLFLLHEIVEKACGLHKIFDVFRLHMDRAMENPPSI